jgi:pimeloyl-ACP methyl ester carboxylesterase
MVAILVGRHLVYNDVWPRSTPNSEILGALNPEEVVFRSHDNLNLRGWFVRPDKDPNGATVIVLHGWHRDRSRIAEHVRLLVQAGFNVLAYDQRGHGASDTGMITFGPAEGKDLLEASNYLLSRSDSHASRLGVIGLSLGTSAIIYALGSERSIPFQCAVLEGVFDVSSEVGGHMLMNKCERLVGRRFGSVLARVIGTAFFTVGSALASLGRFHHARPFEIAARIPALPLLVVRGIDDEMVSEKSARRLIGSLPTTTTLWENLDGHSRSLERNPAEYAARVLSFLNRYLNRQRRGQ